MSLSCGVFLFSVGLYKHVRIPAELCTLYQSVCMSLSSSPALTHAPYLRYLLCHFFSPLQLHFDSLPSCLSLPLCFMLVCTAVFQNLHLTFLAPMRSACHSWDACLSFSSLYFLIPGCLSGWLGVCVYFFLCLFLAVRFSLPHPPTIYHFLSALLHSVSLT